MNMRRYLVVFTLMVVLLPTQPSVLLPMAPAGTPLSQRTLASTAFAYPPNTAQQYPSSLLAVTAGPITTSQQTSLLQGNGPTAIAVTRDGKYAYLGFFGSDTVFKVRLGDFTVEAVADLSSYFPMESVYIYLNASEKALFVHNRTWRKLLVLDTEMMSVTHTIDNIGMDLSCMLRSQYGPFIITCDTGNTVKFVNTETYAVTDFTDEQIGFIKIQESKRDDSIWYVVTQWGANQIVGIYDHVRKVWYPRVSFHQHEGGEVPYDLVVLPNEQKAYLASVGGNYPGENHAYGWVYSIDLVGGNLRVIPIEDGGAACLELSQDSQRLYVGAAMPAPNGSNLLVVDTQSDNIVAQANLGQNPNGNSYTSMNDLQIDLANPSILYATAGDANAFIKVDLDHLTLADVLALNVEIFKPHFFAKLPTQPAGYILIHQSVQAFGFDLQRAVITGVVRFPSRPDVFAFDVVATKTGRLLVAQGETVLEVDPQAMRLIATHPLPPNIQVWYFVLSNDQTRLYSVEQNYFLAINTSTYQVEARFKLEGGDFNWRPYVLPDRPKLYVLGGLYNAPVVIHVISTDNDAVQKTITFDDPSFQGISAGPYYPFAYDTRSHTLFVGATLAVLAIDTDKDIIKKVIHLGDVANAIGLEPTRLAYNIATALVYDPNRNYLYITHYDRCFVSIYDLNEDRFLPQVIPLKAFGPIVAFANDDFTKIYVVNLRSDSVSVINADSKAVEQIIDLHAYWRVYLPVILRGY